MNSYKKNEISAYEYSAICIDANERLNVLKLDDDVISSTN